MGTEKNNKQAVLRVIDADVIDVGVDDGHFGIKVFSEFGETYVPSRVAAGAHIISLADGGDDNLYEAGNQSYTVSDTLPSIDTRFADYGTSDINRVLIHHALIKAGLGGRNVRIVTGLPVADFFVANKPNQEFIARKVASLAEGSVSNKNPDIHCSRIVGNAVQPEAIAAFYDLLIDHEGKVNKDIQELIREGSIGIIDIGGKTTDCAVVINQGKSIDPARSGTSNIGALSLNKAVEQRLKSDYKLDQLSQVQVEKAVMTGTFRVFGKDNDCQGIVDSEKSALAEQIIVDTKRKMRDGADLEKVFFVGGGSLLLRKQLEDMYPHAVFVENPQFSNARGMWKIARYVMK
jgi:plasmid segregation protein ParM